MTFYVFLSCCTRFPEQCLGVDSNPSVSVTMLVPAAPRPSRLSATPQCFFLQIGHWVYIYRYTPVATPLLTVTVEIGPKP